METLSKVADKLKESLARDGGRLWTVKEVKETQELLTKIMENQNEMDAKLKNLISAESATSRESPLTKRVNDSELTRRMDEMRDQINRQFESRETPTTRPPGEVSKSFNHLQFLKC